MLVFDVKRGWFELLVFSPDGRKVAAVADRPPALWVLDGAGRTQPITHFGARSFCFYPTSDWLLSTTGYRTMLSDTAANSTEELAGPIGNATQFTVTPAGQLVSLHEGGAQWSDRLVRVRTWRPGQGGRSELQTELIVGEMGHERWFLWPDGSRVGRVKPAASGAKVREGAILMVPDGSLVGTFATPNKYFRSLLASPQGEQIVTPEGVRLSVWSETDWAAPPRKVQNTNVKHFTGLAFHPSGRYLAATSNDATVKLYDTSSWEVVQAFAWNIGRLRSVAFSPDGMLAAAGSDQGKVVIWDTDL